MATLIPDRLPEFVRRSLQPVDEIVDWGKHGKHRVTWRDGFFEFPQHEELELERVLVALGADPCPCLKLAHLLIHGPEDPLAVFVLSQKNSVQMEGILQLRSMLLQRASQQDDPEKLTRSKDYMFAFALPAPLRLRFGLAVVAWYSGRWGDSQVRALAREPLEALYSKLTDDLLEESWSAKTGPALVQRVLDPGEAVTAGTSPTGNIELGLPVTWAFAWATRPMVENELVLDLKETSEPDELTASVAGYKNGTMGPVRQILVSDPA